MNPAFVISSISRMQPSVMVPTQPNAMSIAVHLAPSGTNEVWLVQILHDDNLGAVDAGYVFAIGAGVIRLFMGGVAGLNHHGDSPADHRAHLGHEICGRLEVESIGGDVL